MQQSIGRTVSNILDLCVHWSSNRKILSKTLSLQKLNFSVQRQADSTLSRFSYSCRTAKAIRPRKSLSTTACYFENSNYSHSFYCNMNSKHLGPGSDCPPLQEGKLRIYSMRFCPFAQRAILVAVAKGIPHDVVNCQLKEKPEWLLERNHNGKVPVLEFLDGRILFESLIVSEYFDGAYQNRPLLPLDPYEKAIDQMWIQEFSQVIRLFYKVLFAANAGETDDLTTRFNELQLVIARFEKELCRRGTTFFGGNSLPGMMDYMIWPWVERLPAFKYFASKDHFDVQRLKVVNPKLECWRQHMKQDFAVKEFFLPPDVHKQFIQGFLDKNLNYDILEASPKL